MAVHPNSVANLIPIRNGDDPRRVTNGRTGRPGIAATIRRFTEAKAYGTTKDKKGKVVTRPVEYDGQHLTNEEAVIIRAVQDARNGDARARDYLTDHVYGKATQRQELTGANGAPLFDTSGLSVEEIQKLILNELADFEAFGGSLSALLSPVASGAGTKSKAKSKKGLVGATSNRVLRTKAASEDVERAGGNSRKRKGQSSDGG